MKPNKPIAAEHNEPPDLWGAMSGTGEVRSDLKLTRPSGEIWNADS